MVIRRVVIVHNNPLLRQRLATLLSAQACDVVIAHDGAELLSRVAEGCDAAIVDVNTIDIWDKEYVGKLRAEAPELPLVLTIHPGRIESYVALVSTGACEHLAEPFREEQVKLLLRRLGEQQTLLEQNRYLWAELERARGETRLTTCDPRMIQILRQATKVAATDVSVLILGERGTEKEKVARLLHTASPRRSGPFIRVDCTARDETSFDRLFSKNAGGFSDLVEGGTLFLDEVTQMGPQAQARLLRALDEDAGPRLVCSASDDPFEDVEREVFREDLFFRLNAAQVFVPPLRERAADIPLLAAEFMEQFGLAKPQMGWEELTEYDWPGNVTELEAAVRLAALRRGNCENAAEDLLPRNCRARNRRRFRHS
jgi:two-component system response regulator AtoC